MGPSLLPNPNHVAAHMSPGTGLFFSFSAYAALSAYRRYGNILLSAKEYGSYSSIKKAKVKKGAMIKDAVSAKGECLLLPLAGAGTRMLFRGRAGR